LLLLLLPPLLLPLLLLLLWLCRCVSQSCMYGKRAIADLLTFAFCASA
jgi:hypothetical protein